MLLMKGQKMQQAAFNMNAIVAYHHSEIMLAGARIATNEQRELSTADLFKANSEELVRMRTHSDILFQLSQTAPNGDNGLIVTIGNTSDGTLALVYGQDVFDTAAKSDPQWSGLFYLDKLRILRERFIELKNIAPPTVTLSL